MNYIWSCERPHFVDLISSRTPVPSDGLRQSEGVHDVAVHGDDVVLVWDSLPTGKFSLPRCVIVPEEKTQDFLAWVSTYFRNIRPFTAHCRVESPLSAELAARSESTDWPNDNRSVDLGLIITEAIAYSVGRADIGRLPFTAFTRTMSYALGRAIRNFESALHGDRSYLDRVQHGWSLTRELVAESPLELRAADICDVWEIVLTRDNAKMATGGNAESDRLVAEALNDLQRDGRLSKDRWCSLLADANQADALWSAMEGPREGRVLAVENGIRILGRGTKATRRRRAFTAGYLASRVQPGTLDHLALLFPLVSDMRESLLWFGVCAGLVPETTIDNYANGVGWLMRRELGRQWHWLDRPFCDIALVELKTLLESRNGGRPAFRTASNGVLEVEILPLVTTNIRWADPADDHERQYRKPVGQRTLFESDARLEMEVRDILRRIEESSMSLDAIRQHVERAFGTSSSKGRKRRK